MDAVQFALRAPTADLEAARRWQIRTSGTADELQDRRVDVQASYPGS